MKLYDFIRRDIQVINVSKHEKKTVGFDFVDIETRVTYTVQLTYDGDLAVDEIYREE